MKGRNDAIRVVAGLGNDDDVRKIWKILTHYHKRSLGETAMFRFKKLFGGDFAPAQCRTKRQSYMQSASNEQNDRHRNAKRNLDAE